jgi:hypothetical protein
MVKRLVDEYNVGDRVTISFQGDERWWPGRVIWLDHPGVWVQTPDGQVWFVTNARRIRRMNHQHT